MLKIHIPKHAVNVTNLLCGLTDESPKTKTRSLNWHLNTVYIEGDIRLSIVSENAYNGDLRNHYASYEGIVSIRSRNPQIEDMQFKIATKKSVNICLTETLLHCIDDTFIAYNHFEVYADLVCTYISDLLRTPLSPSVLLRESKLSLCEIGALGYIKDPVSEHYIHLALLAVYYPCLLENVTETPEGCPTLSPSSSGSCSLSRVENDLYAPATFKSFLSGEGLIGLEWILMHRNCCSPHQSFDHSVNIPQLMKYGYAFTHECYGKEWVFELRSEHKQLKGGYFRFSSYPSPLKTHEIFTVQLSLRADDKQIYEKEHICGPISLITYDSLNCDLTNIKNFTVSAHIKCLDRGHVLSQRINFSCSDLKLQDVSFLVEGELIYAHKAFLSYHSNFFKALFEREDTTKTITLSDLSYTAFHNALTILYRGEFVINENNVIPLVKLADRLDLGFVMDACEHFLRSTHNLDRVDLLVLASNYGLEQLAYEVCDILCRKYHFDDIKNTSEYTMLDEAMQKLVEFRFEP